MISRGWKKAVLVVFLGAAISFGLPKGHEGDALPDHRVFAAGKDIQVTLNGQVIEFDVKPLNMEGRTYVPFRKLLESLGATVTWDQDKQTAAAVKDGLTLTIPLASQVITLEGHELTMDVPTIIMGNRILVPLRFTAQALGAKVDWTSENGVDRIAMTQNYDVMIDRLVNGKNADGDMKVTYEQAVILFEWLYKGQEKGELPKFTGLEPVKLPSGAGYYPISGQGNEYLKFWNGMLGKYGPISSSINREVYTKGLRISVQSIFQNDGKKVVTTFIEMADQSKTKGIDKGIYLIGYYPEP